MKELKNKYDIAFVASFGKFLSNSVIKAFPLGVYNIHPSLLPKYRGPCPLYHTLLNEDLYTGSTIFKILPTEKGENNSYDTGPILARDWIKISDLYEYKNIENKSGILNILIDRIAQFSANILKESWPFLLNPSTHLNLRPQSCPTILDLKYKISPFINPDKNNSTFIIDGPTYAPKLDWIKLLNVNWANTNPLQLIKLYYILGIQYNGLRSKFMGHIVKLLNPFLLCQFKENHDIFLLDQLYSKHLILKKLSNITSLNSQSQSLHVDCDQITRDKPLPGALFYSYQFNSIFIASYQSNNQNSNINWKWIGFKDVKYRGTKMTAFDFYNGYLSKPDYQTEILEGVD
ncbi:unnamed protein product [Gordionus sp. m RMFG-2023]